MNEYLEKFIRSKLFKIIWVVFTIFFIYSAYEEFSDIYRYSLNRGLVEGVIVNVNESIHSSPKYCRSPKSRAGDIVYDVAYKISQSNYENSFCYFENGFYLNQNVSLMYKKDNPNSALPKVVFDRWLRDSLLTYSIGLTILIFGIIFMLIRKDLFK